MAVVSPVIQMGGHSLTPNVAMTSQLPVTPHVPRSPYVPVTPYLRDGSSVDTEVDLLDSEEYDTDLEDEKVQVEKKPYIGRHAYKRICSKSRVAPQNAVLAMLNEHDMNLHGRNLGPVGIRPVLVALTKNTRVQCLDLSDTGLENQGAAYVAQLLLDNDFIFNLNLSENFIGPEGMLALSEALKYNDGLIRLNLSKNNIDDTAAEWLSHAIQMNERLEELDLSHNKLETAAGKFIGQGLAKNSCVETLNLSWNSIRREGALGIFKCLQKNSTLVHLDISHNGLAYDGALAVSNMLQKNTTLQYLDISGNNMTWQAALLITPGIRANKTLKVLKIGDNPLTTTGGMDIMEAVSCNNCNINFLSLKNTPVIGEFEMLAIAVRQVRNFNYEHGGIVTSHDMLGQRIDRKLDPMAKIIQYMKERSLRATELFRSFDKQVANSITNDEFVYRLQKAGVTMPRYELEELLEHLTRTKSTEKLNEPLSYKTMIKTVKDQVEKDRVEAIKERERRRRIQSYHKKILSQGVIHEEQVEDIKDAIGSPSDNDTQSIQGMIDSLKRFNMNSAASNMEYRSASNVSSPRKLTPTLPPLTGSGVKLGDSSASASAAMMKIMKLKPQVAGSAGDNTSTQRSGIISMSGALGGKVKPFGEQSVKGKRGKRKKRKRAGARK